MKERPHPIFDPEKQTWYFQPHKAVSVEKQAELQKRFLKAANDLIAVLPTPKEFANVILPEHLLRLITDLNSDTWTTKNSTNEEEEEEEKEEEEEEEKEEEEKQKQEQEQHKHKQKQQEEDQQQQQEQQQQEQQHKQEQQEPQHKQKQQEQQQSKRRKAVDIAAPSTSRQEQQGVESITPATKRQKSTQSELTE